MDNKSSTSTKSQELPENADWASYEWNGSSPADDWLLKQTSDHSGDDESCQGSIVNMHTKAHQPFYGESSKRDRESHMQFESLPPAKKAFVSPPSPFHKEESDSNQKTELSYDLKVEECNKSSDSNESPFKLMPDFSKPVNVRNKDMKIDSLSNSYYDSYSVMSESMSTNPDGSMFNSISSMWDTESESVKAGPQSLEEREEQFPLELNKEEPSESSKTIREELQEEVVPVKKKKKNKKKKKLKVNDEGEENAKEKKPRPNYFVGIQISCPEIHQAIVQVQEHMIQTDPELSKVLVDVATAHITLLVATISDENALHVACAALDHCGAQLMEDLEANPLKLTFSGVGHFSHQTVYVKIVEDEGYERLIDIGMEVRRVFNEKGVIMPDERPLHPHLTIAKMSKAPRGRGKCGPRKVDSSAFAAYTEKYFGSQMVFSLQLLGMNKPKDSKRYFFNSREVIFDVPQLLNDDHSLCCFPRRPFVSHHRNYSSLASSEESSRVWSTPGLVTVMAGATITAVVAFLAVKYLRR
ncbi:uncharacterized protein LOC143023853 isoform X2 [Oratosquilla oratoria]